MFGFPRQSRDSCTTRLYLPAHAQTKVPSVLLEDFWEISFSYFSKVETLKNGRHFVANFFFFFFLITCNNLHDSGADNRTDKIPNKVLPHIILTNNYYRTSFTLQIKILNTYIYEQQSLIDERHLHEYFERISAILFYYLHILSVPK